MCRNKKTNSEYELPKSLFTTALYLDITYYKKHQLFYISFATKNVHMEAVGGLSFLLSAEQGQDWGIIFVVLSAQSKGKIVDVLYSGALFSTIPLLNF